MESQALGGATRFSPVPRISLVIPAFNEEVLLPALLASVAVARERFGPSERTQVVVADNASTDRTAELARAAGVELVRVETRAIAAARNGGAAAARGEIVAFIDADSRIHPDTFAVIERTLADSRTIGGATGVTLDRWSLGLAATYAAMLPTVWLLGVDTGVVFCRRRDFEAIGGYDEGRRVAEDVDFLFRLKRLGRDRAQRFVRPRGAKAVTSTRKFDQHGDWHFFHVGARVGWAILRGSRNADPLVASHWYDVRPPRPSDEV